MILTNFLSAYDVIARRALSARIFCVACGLNLAGPGVIADIEHAFQMRPCWQSIVLPAAASVLPSEYIGILPQIFTHLYYLGTPLASALARVWAARKPAAYHTDLVVFEKPNEGGEPSIIKYTYGSASSRPWGLVLPEPGSLCICATSTDAVKWIRQGNSEETKFRERLVRYRSSCGHVYLRIAICLDGVKTTKAAGVQIVKQPFDRKKSAFPLDSRDWFHFDVYKVVDPKRMSKFRDHKEPWTLRGRMLQPKVTEGVNGAQPKSTHASPREG
ncbi:hypothetical protein BDV93DRAFT_549497 [Ceratobasidium sp. AG-I]|nr:hypothetical protein BDV93DRAFT_549497 [Ceratobasidium sp. AG-I]